MMAGKCYRCLPVSAKGLGFRVTANRGHDTVRRFALFLSTWRTVAAGTLGVSAAEDTAVCFYSGFPFHAPSTSCV